MRTAFGRTGLLLLLRKVTVGYARQAVQAKAGGLDVSGGDMLARWCDEN